MSHLAARGVRPHASTLKATVVALLAASALLLTTGCGGKEAPLTEEQRASLAAKECYEGLYIHERPETFLDGRIDAGRMPQSFRRQLLDDYRQHLQQVARQRKGVRSISATNARRDKTLQLMQVFLTLSYGNGTQEEIVVPMVQAADGSWHLK